MDTFARHVGLTTCIVLCLASTACHTRTTAGLGANWTGDSGGWIGDGNGLRQPKVVGCGLAPAPLPLDAETVFFEFDSYALTKPAMEVLEEKAKELKANLGTATITVEGHCDERGTQEYNLALGDRRAAAVRKFLTDLGVSEQRISIISYGKEKPAVEGHDESAWSKNRRAEFKPSS